MSCDVSKLQNLKYITELLAFINTRPITLEDPFILSDLSLQSANSFCLPRYTEQSWSDPTLVLSLSPGQKAFHSLGPFFFRAQLPETKCPPKGRASCVWASHQLPGTAWPCSGVHVQRYTALEPGHLSRRSGAMKKTTSHVGLCVRPSCSFLAGIFWFSM